MVKAAKRPPPALQSAECRPRKVAAAVEGVACGGFDAPFGKLVITASDSGIRSIGIGHQPRVSAAVVDHRSGTATSSASASCSRAQEHIRQALVELGEYFAGQRTAFTLPLDARGTPFQLLAWSALSRIPFGSTSSYLQVTTALALCCQKTTC
jgi:O6-methylguanine-DNA--protein-cysteine methyltransferase